MDLGIERDSLGVSFDNDINMIDNAIKKSRPRIVKPVARPSSAPSTITLQKSKNTHLKNAHSLFDNKNTAPKPVRGRNKSK